MIFLECESEFQSGLESLLSVLENPSPLAIALVSQLNESLWWIRGHTVDKELLLHETIARLLSREGSNWVGSRNSALLVPREHYLNGSAQKDQAALIEEALIDANLTLSDPHAKAFQDAARHIKIVDNLIHLQHQRMRHLQWSIDSIDGKSRLI